MEIKIGLENHVRINTKKKLFCLCTNDTEKSPNTNVCGICCGFPGYLPIVNFESIDKVSFLSQYLGCQVSKNITFDRKHYNYHDLPKGYQITQLNNPIGVLGNVYTPYGYITIDRISIEEDAAKTIVVDKKKIIDYNRSGTVLAEITTKPDFTSIEQVIFYLKTLKVLLLKYNLISLHNSDAIRCDVNISLQEKQNFTNRTEIKNVNSITDIKKAINFEVDRQKKFLYSNEKNVFETRSWNHITQKTESMRVKEQENQYKFTKEWDIPICNNKNTKAIENDFFFIISDLFKNIQNLDVSEFDDILKYAAFFNLKDYKEHKITTKKTLKILNILSLYLKHNRINLLYKKEKHNLEQNTLQNIEKKLQINDLSFKPDEKIMILEADIKTFIKNLDPDILLEASKSKFGKLIKNAKNKWGNTLDIPQFLIKLMEIDSRFKK